MGPGRQSETPDRLAPVRSHQLQRRLGLALLPPGRLQGLVLLPPLLARVELGEAVADDGDGQPDHQHAEDRAEAAENLAEAGDWTHVSVTHLEYRDTVMWW